MVEKKSKTAKKKKSTSKTTGKKNHKLHPEDVRHEVLEMVEDHAQAMTQAVIQQAEEQGQLATVKYLFEVANILPSPKDGSEASKEEDSLAETLLDRLNIPKVPVNRDEGEGFAVSEERSEADGEEKEETSGE